MLFLLWCNYKIFFYDFVLQGSTSRCPTCGKRRFGPSKIEKKLCPTLCLNTPQGWIKGRIYRYSPAVDTPVKFFLLPAKSSRG